MQRLRKKIGTQFETAWRWCKAGTLRGHQLPTDTLTLIEDEASRTKDTLETIVNALTKGK